MKAISIAAVLLSAGAGAATTQWTPVGRTGDGQAWSYDPATVDVVGRLRGVSIRVDLPGAQRVRTMLVRAVIRCDTRGIKNMSMRSFDAQGRTVQSFGDMPGDFDAIEPGSATARLADRLCPAR